MNKYLSLFFVVFLSLGLKAECVLKNNTTLYSDLGKTPVWVVAKNMPLTVLKQKKNWSSVRDVDGYKYWVQTKNLAGKKTQCVVVKLKKVNLRVGPSIKDPLHKFRIADKYTTFKVLIKNKSWLFVESSLGFKAWLAKSAVWPRIK